jgi:hypothetical protein
MLFQDGLIGEDNWSLIAKHVGTRDRFQVFTSGKIEFGDAESLDFGDFS